MTFINTPKGNPYLEVVEDGEFDYNYENTINLFDKLGQYEKAPNESYLRGLIGSMVEGFRDGLNERMSKLKISNNDIRTLGQFNKNTDGIHISISENKLSHQYQTAQEVFAHELVHKATDFALNKNAPRVVKEAALYPPTTV